MGETLYIIGNGFDIHHGIKSSYMEFGEYLKHNDRDTYSAVEKYFDVGAHGFWSDFENQLAHFDAGKLIEEASDFLVPHNSDEWRDADNHSYHNEIEDVVDAISKTMLTRFGEWIRQLCIPEPAEMEIMDLFLSVDPSAQFLNFNYTPTLQSLYGVPNSQVLHIHGRASDAEELLVLGHGWDPAGKRPIRYHPTRDPQGWDVRVTEGSQLVEKYFKSTFKPTTRVIHDNAGFFAGLADVERIYVMGHSMAEVDHPYFREVVRSIDAKRVDWKISYRTNPPAERVGDIGIHPDQFEFAKLADF